MPRLRSMDSIHNLWRSVLATNAYPECHDDDEEILKASLLLKSTFNLFSGLRLKEQSCSTQLSCLKEKVEKSEAEKGLLESEILRLKSEVLSLETKVQKFKHDSEAAVEKLERLKSKISAEVEARLNTMFKNCLQQNKAATVLDMMTQMYQDTELPETELLNRPTLPKLHKNVDTGSPDVILNTPQKSKGKKGMRYETAKQVSETVTSTKSQSTCKPASVDREFAREFVTSSPDEIASTPPAIRMKDSKKRFESFSKLLIKEKEEETEDAFGIPSKTVVYAKDTQDDEINLARPALSENIMIPETLNPGSLEVYIEDKIDLNKVQGKENERIPPSSPCKQVIKIADLSTDVDFPSTPKKSTKPKEGSPILGNSSSKKSNSRSMNSTVVDSSSKTRKGSQSKANSRIRGSHLLSAADFEYRITPSGKKKKSVQPKIRGFCKSTSKLSLSSSKLRGKDISKIPEFNGGQRLAPDLAYRTSQLTEDQQVEIAVRNSCDSSADDSDTTVFEPKISPGQSKQADSLQHRKRSQPKTTGHFGSFSETLFDPQGSSTAKDEDVLSERSTKNFYFEPNGASTAKDDVTQPSSPEDELENSALTKLVQMMGNDDTAPYPLETSYDRLPPANSGPNYLYKRDPVRKKAERRELPGLECTQCGGYYIAAFGADPQSKKSVVDRCSRHRDYGPRARTPPGFWDPNFPPTPELRKRQEQSP